MSEFDVKFALGIVIMLNVVLFLAQLGINSISTEAGEDATVYFNYGDSMLSDFDKDGTYHLKEFDPNDLPDSEGGVTTDGGFFTDVFQTVKSWFLSIPGARYVLGIVNAVPNFLQIFGLPNEIVFAIGFIWHVMTLFLIVMLLKG